MAIVQDIRFGVRNLRRSPVFTAVAVLSLALGIGANTAMFTLADQTLLRWLPVERPRELALVHREGGNWGNVFGDNRFSYPQYRDLRDRSEVFSGLLAYYQATVALTVRDQAERTQAVLVSGNFFETLGVRPALGRTIAPEDDAPGAHPVAVLGYRYWQRRFAADPGILGRSLAVNGHPVTVIGVAAADFTGLEAGEAPDFMVPLSLKARITPTWDGMEDRRAMWLQLVGRLRPGVSSEQAQAALNAFLRPILEMEYDTDPDEVKPDRKRWLSQRIVLAPGHKGNSDVPSEARLAVIVLMCITGVVLLIACANVANLLLARAAGREREVAVRLALGARRSHIVRQMLAESLLLAVAGALAGLLAGAWTTSAVLQLLPEDAAAFLDPEPDGRVLLFGLALAFATTLLFGLAPALGASRPALAGTLKDQGAATGPGARHARLRKALVVAQVALSLVLVASAGLFARSLRNLKSVDPGFRTANILTFRLNPALCGYGAARAADYYGRAQERLAAVPGVLSVSLSNNPLLAGYRSTSTITVEGYRRKPGEDMNPDAFEIAPGLFRTLGIPLAAGRDLTPADAAGAPRVAVINRAMARYFFGRENPLGRRFGVGKRTQDIEIVGVVDDIRITRLRETPRRAFFLPYSQSREIGPMTVYARTAGDPAAMAPALRNELRALDPAVPVFFLRTMRAQIDQSLVVERVVAALSSAFGLLATVLAAVGLYGVMAFTVARRTREIGVRMALGARRADVLRLVMREAAVTAAIGIAIALPAVYALGGFLRALLWGLAPDDPLTLASAAFITLAVVLSAGAVPALRAAGIDPVRALHYD